MTLRTTFTTAVVANALAWACVAAPAQAELISREKRVTPITTHGTYAAWSHFDGRAYRLVLWHDGTKRTLPIRSRPAPFDADLGRDARGRLVAVYSRCKDSVDNEGCDLFRYDVKTRKERRLTRPSRRATSEFLPAIDDDRLVFARAIEAGKIPQLISATLDRYRERRLPRPSGFADEEIDGGNYGPLTIDVASDRAVVGWEHVPIPCPNKDQERGFAWSASIIVLYDLAPRRRRVVEDDCVLQDRGGAAFFSPSIDERFVYYAFDPAGQPDDNRSLRRIELTSGAVSDTPNGTDWVRATQTSGGWTWAVTDASNRRYAVRRTAAPSS